jgi:excisionase family DNA binding protein
MERELMATGEARIISLAEAAKLLGVSYPTTVRLATDGELKAFRVRKVWRTSTTACEDYVNERFRAQEAACRARSAGM